MSSRERFRDEGNREELVERIEAATKSDGIHKLAPGLFFARASQPTARIYGNTHPSLCVIARGAKEILVGDATYRYDPEHYLLATVDLPMTGRIVEAFPERPYLSLRLDLDPALVGSVMLEAGQLKAPRSGDSKAIVVSGFDSTLLESVLRLVRIVSSPVEERVLLPLIKREIVFRLLMGEQGSRLRRLPMPGSHSDRIAEAIDRLRKNLDQPTSIEGLAKELGMSPSGFHHHFKAVTDMSPLQFQKQLRLQEARRLMLSEYLDASSAGSRVGYENPSHFSRDYKNHFGNSPLRDVDRLRAMTAAD